MGSGDVIPLNYTLKMVMIVNFMFVSLYHNLKIGLKN